MTQTLQFEAAWEKQVSPQDRQLIEERFQQIKNIDGNDLSFSYLRHDYNHRKAFLLLVLMNNDTVEPVTISEKQLYCHDEDGKQIAVQTFSLPFKIPANTSMPWTFIFPNDTYKNIGTQSELTLNIK